MTCKICYIFCIVLTVFLIATALQLDVGPERSIATKMETLAPVATGIDLTIRTDSETTPAPPAPVLVPVKIEPFSLDKIENMVLRWIAFGMSVISALTGLILFILGKVIEIRKASIENKANMEARMDRQDSRASAAINEAKTLVVENAKVIDEKIAKAVPEEVKKQTQRLDLPPPPHR